METRRAKRHGMFWISPERQMPEQAESVWGRKRPGDEASFASPYSKVGRYGWIRYGGNKVGYWCHCSHEPTPLGLTVM
jgi:hypothetical protein